MERLPDAAMAGRRPESVLVIVHAGRRVLMLKRVAPFGFWQSVTGSLEAEESPPEAAVREVREETGLDARGRLVATGVARSFVIDPRWRHRYPPGVSENREYEFRLPLDEEADIVHDPREHDAWRWCDIEEAIELAWSSTNRAGLTDLRGAL